MITHPQVFRTNDPLILDRDVPALGLGSGSAGRSCASLTTESVTVLFTDMVGSTALATSLAPDAADEFRREHFSILR